MPTQAVFSYPAVGKHVRFNSLAHHGVVGSACAQRCEEKRMVVLINWCDWRLDRPAATV